MTNEELEKYDSIELNDKVYFLSQKTPMTVKARSKRYIILTEPFYRQRTFYHSIIDLDQGIKAPNDRIISPYDYSNQVDIDMCLYDLIHGKVEVSQKRSMEIDIDWEKTQARKEKNSKKSK